MNMCRYLEIVAYTVFTRQNIVNLLLVYIEMLVYRLENLSVQVCILLVTTDLQYPLMSLPWPGEAMCVIRAGFLWSCEYSCLQGLLTALYCCERYVIQGCLSPWFRWKLFWPTILLLKLKLLHGRSINRLVWLFYHGTSFIVLYAFS